MRSVACPEQPTPTDVCSEASCQRAYTHPITCRCSCRGSAHGSAHTGRVVDLGAGAAMFAARLARHGGDVFALLGAQTAVDEAPVLARAARVARLALLNEEDYL